MRVTRKRTGIHPPTLHLCCWPLQDTYKYLGIVLSSDLSWTQNIQSTCGKVRKLIGLIYRHFYQCSNSESLFQMYISLVCPHLEYANQVWNPYKTGEINSLEDVQKFALRCVQNTGIVVMTIYTAFSPPITAAMQTIFHHV